MEITRREVLGGIGGLALVVAATPTATPSAFTATVPWKYAKLDLGAVAERGYAAYSQGGCMFGAFEGVIGELRATVGSPYDAFPAAMMKYGKAGAAGWGTLCGALNGAAAAISLVAKPEVADALIHTLYTWYGETPLPNYAPKTPKFKIATSTANSPLCHVSVTRWCEATGLKALSPERADRCGQLTASVAKRTVELLNDMADGKTVAAPAVVAEVVTCLGCHGKGGVLENVHASRGNACSICHEPTGHPIALKK